MMKCAHVCVCINKTAGRRPPECRCRPLCMTLNMGYICEQKFTKIIWIKMDPFRWSIELNFNKTVFELKWSKWFESRFEPSPLVTTECMLSDSIVTRIVATMARFTHTSVPRHKRFCTFCRRKSAMYYYTKYNYEFVHGVGPLCIQHVGPT